MNGRILIGLALCSILIGCNNSNNTPKPAHHTAEAPKSDPSWSEPVHGLRARLEVLPPKKEVSPAENHGPFCRVYIEFQNISGVAGNMRIRFAPHKLKLAVVDQNGKKLATGRNGVEVYDGISPTWEESVLVPYSGTLKFQISSSGLGYMPGKDKAIVDMGPSRSWIIPQDDSTYYLSGSLTIEKEEGDHPHDWSGTLQLPKATIPREKK